MSSIAYINALAARGIQLWSQDGKLQYKAPRDAMTAELLAELKANKAVLVDLLAQFAGTEGTGPLSFSQKSLWSLHQLDPQSAAYNVTYAARLDDALDVPALTRCVDYLIARHPILRTRYAVADGQPQQQVTTGASARLVIERVFDAGAGAILEWVDEAANQPFDLSVSPIRLTLLVNVLTESASPAPRHVLLLNVHHIAADFWSLEIMVRELGALYRLALAGEPLRLPPLTLRYKDCVQHEADRLQGPEGRALVAFWAHELRGDLPVLALQTDRPRPPIKTEQGRVHRLAWGDLTSQAVRDAAKVLQVTPYMLLLSVYQLFLFLHTGQQRLLIGAPTAGRNLRGSEQVLGHFVNTVVLACELEPQDRFADLVARTRAMMLRVMDHQDLPFPLLVEKQRPPRDPSRSPLFQVMYNWNQLRQGAAPDDDRPRLFGETLAASSTGTRGATHDLTLNVQDDGRGYTCAWTYNTDLFDERTVARYAAQFEGLVHQVLVDATRRIAQYRMASHASRTATLERIAAAVRDGDGTARTLRTVSARLARHPQRLAWRLGDQAVSHADVAEAAGRLQAALGAAGVGAGQPVGLQVASAAERAVGLLAVLGLGACVSDEGTHGVACVHGSGQLWSPQDIIVTAHPAVEPPPASTTTAQIDRFIGGLGRGVSIDDTSRTLLPDGVPAQLAAGWLLASLGRGDVTIVPAGVSVASLADATPAVALAALATVVEEIVRNECTVVVAPDLLLPALGTRHLGGLRTVVGFGDHPHALVHPTATLRFLPGACLGRWAGPVVLAPAGDGWRLVAAEGRYPLPVLLGPFGDLADEHQAGRLHLLLDHCIPPDPASGPGAGGLADLAQVWMHHRVLTTPLVMTDRQGDLRCAHPSPREVRHRVTPFPVGPVETFLASRPGVEEVVCVVHDMPWGPVFTAHVRFTDEVPPLDMEAALRRELKRALPEMQHPEAILRIACMPLTAEGCLDSDRLPAPPRRAERTRAAGSDTERALATIWCEVLSLSAVSVDDDFFELGGDSILAAVIVARASQEGLYLQPKDLFEHTTIAGLARVVTAAPQIRADQGVVTGDVVAGPAAAWFFDRVVEDRSHFNQALLVSLREAPDAALMQETLRQVARHHDALRSRFTARDGVWWQVFDDGAAGPVFDQVRCAGTEPWHEAIAAVQASLDISSGPLWRVRWLDKGSVASSRLLIVVHHLVIDGVSWNVLLQDIADTYTRLASGASARLPLKTSSAMAWVEAWHQQASGDTMAVSRAHWLPFGATLQRALDAGGVAFMRHRRLGTAPALAPLHRTPGFCSVTFDTQLTAAFRTTAHQAYGTDANDLLLAALQAGVRSWGDSTALLIDLEGHGRDALADSVDISRTIGWFTSIYPVLLEAPRSEEPGALIKRIKQTLRQVPDKGAGFGVLRYLADEGTRSALAALPASPLLFTYLGSLDAVAGSSPWYAGSVEPAPGIRSARQHRTHLFDMCAYVSAGQLTIDCTFEGGDMVEESIGRLMDHVRESLVMLIRHCCSEEAGGLTPSDVPGVDLDQEGLDALLDEVAALAG